MESDGDKSNRNEPWDPLVDKKHTHGFLHHFAVMQQMAAQDARKNGWEITNDAEQIALMHSELSEALEGIRKGDPPDSHIPQFTSQEAELADVMIRIFHYSGAKKLRVGEAILAKMLYNRTRGNRHGNKAF